jgi:type IV pilus assembly protein PilW
VGTTGVYSVSRYFLRADSTASSPSALACDAGRYADGDASVTGFGDNGVVLLSSVDNFQVLYGISASSTTTTPVRYVNSADYMALATPRPRIGAIRFGVLVRSSDGVGNLAVGSSTINVLDNAITGASQDASDARLLRRVFVSTVALRNVITPTP